MIPTHKGMVCVGLLLSLAGYSRLAGSPAQYDAHWPSFRGRNASGVAEGYPLPTTWNVPESKNVRWKTVISGLAHSSPVIWGDRLFVTTAISGNPKVELRVGLYGDVTPVNDDTVHEWKVYCLNKVNGRIVWERTAHKGAPKIKRHTKGTQANSTMATDGKHAVAFFGSEGMYCYDFNGKLLWKKDLGVLDSGWFVMPAAQWGFASSPIIHEGMAIVQCDVQKNSFLAGFEVKTGRELWRTPRDDVPTWSTPTILQTGSQKQLIVNGYKHIGGYDPKTGKELWKLRGGGDIPVPTPVAAHGLIFITNAHGRMAPIYAIRDSARGDITPQDAPPPQPSPLEGEGAGRGNLAWWHMREGGYMQTPLVYGDYLYVCRDNGALSCYEAKTGKRLYQERLGTGRTGFTASAVAGGGKIYYTSEEGDIFVVKAGPTFELLAQNPMGEICMATPAISEGALFFRTQGNVVAIGTGK